MGAAIAGHHQMIDVGVFLTPDGFVGALFNAVISGLGVGCALLALSLLHDRV